MVTGVGGWRGGAAVDRGMIEQVLAASAVQIGVCDPRRPAARRAVPAYVPDSTRHNSAVGLQPPEYSHV